MEQTDVFAEWKQRAEAAGSSLAAVRRRAGIHAANFCNWKNGKKGMTLASMSRVEAALREIEAAKSQGEAA